MYFVGEAKNNVKVLSFQKVKYAVSSLIKTIPTITWSFQRPIWTKKMNNLNNSIFPTSTTIYKGQQSYLNAIKLNSNIIQDNN